MSSTRVYGEAVQKLKLNPKTLGAYTRTTIVQENSNVLELEVKGPDPEVAALLANNIGQIGINYIKGIYQVFDISFLDQAARPANPVSPQPLRDGGIAAGIGLLLGLLLAILQEQLRLPLEALRERSIHDRASGAYTQRYFRQVFEQTLASHPDETVSLSIIELSGLIDLADNLPEAVLSGLMHKVTDLLHEQLRGNDLVGRWGKIGFALLLPSTPEAAATRTLERICVILRYPLEVDGLDKRINLAPHGGLACRCANENPPELIRQVEEALEFSRGTGDCVSYSTITKKGG